MLEEIHLCFLDWIFIGLKYLTTLFFSLYKIIMNFISKIYLN